jgi:hypothetical protein
VQATTRILCALRVGCDARYEEDVGFKITIIQRAAHAPDISAKPPPYVSTYATTHYVMPFQIHDSRREALLGSPQQCATSSSILSTLKRPKGTQARRTSERVSLGTIQSKIHACRRLVISIRIHSTIIQSELCNILWHIWCRVPFSGYPDAWPESAKWGGGMP